MAKDMLINVSEGEECRIALLENNRLDEFYIERTSSTSHVGNIYKGRVVNVEPSIQAAFVDFGLGRNGFLHISDLLPTYFARNGEDYAESVGHKLARRDRPPIQRCLRRGDELVVQIIKEGIGTKGPTLTSYLSIPGRILVMMPGMAQMGVSRKIEDEPERKRLRQILDSLEPSQDCGFIIRTAGVGKTKAEIQRDLAYLTRLWQQISKEIQTGPCPLELYTEGDLVTRTVRDVFTNDVDRIIVDHKDVARRVRDFIKLTSPRAKDKVELYEEAIPLFHKYGIEKEIEMMYSRHVPLPSGGSLVIDQTEAVVAIDVNSGKFRDHSDAETTAFKTDMEAADEIPRQLKLRDLGGVIICDFIDLRYDRHRQELDHKLQQNFKDDRAKTKVLHMSQFGIIEITRQRMRPSVKKAIYHDCPHCRGSGLVKTPESMSLDVMRKLAIATNDVRVVRVDLTVQNEIANFLGNRKRRQLADLEQQTGKHILIKTDALMGLDEVRFELFDARDGVVTVLELLSHTPQTIQEAQLLAKTPWSGPEHREQPSQGRQGGSARGPAGDERGEDFDIEDIEEAIDRRGEVESESEEEREENAQGETGTEDNVQTGRREEPGRRDFRPMQGQQGQRDLRPVLPQRPALQRPQIQPPQRPIIQQPQRPMLPPLPGRVVQQPVQRQGGVPQPMQVNSPRPPEQGGQSRYVAPGGPQGSPVQQGEFDGNQGGYDRDNNEEEGDGRGRRRRRRGRGRGRDEDQQQQQAGPVSGNVGRPSENSDDLMRRLPSNIWIQSANDVTPQISGHSAGDDRAPQRQPEPMRREQPVRVEQSNDRQQPPVQRQQPAGRQERPDQRQQPMRSAPVQGGSTEPRMGPVAPMAPRQPIVQPNVQRGPVTPLNPNRFAIIRNVPKAPNEANVANVANVPTVAQVPTIAKLPSVPGVRNVPTVRNAPLVRVSPIAQGPAVAAEREPIVVKMQPAKAIQIMPRKVIEKESRKATIQEGPIGEPVQPGASERAKPVSAIAGSAIAQAVKPAAKKAKKAVVAKAVKPAKAKEPAAKPVKAAKTAKPKKAAKSARGLDVVPEEIM